MHVERFLSSKKVRMNQSSLSWWWSLSGGLIRAAYFSIFWFSSEALLKGFSRKTGKARFQRFMSLIWVRTPNKLALLWSWIWLQNHGCSGTCIPKSIKDLVCYWDWSRDLSLPNMIINNGLVSDAYGWNYWISHLQVLSYFALVRTGDILLSLVNIIYYLMGKLVLIDIESMMHVRASLRCAWMKVTFVSKMRRTIFHPLRPPSECLINLPSWCTLTNEHNLMYSLE